MGIVARGILGLAWLAGVAVAPVQASEPVSLEWIEETRAAYLEARAARSSEALAAERARLQAMVAWALRPEADALFDPDGRQQAASMRRACADGDQAACTALGQLYQSGQGVWEDRPLAAALFFLGCTEGVDVACEAFSTARHVEVVDYVGSYPDQPHYEQRCAEGHAPSCAQLGSIVRFGRGGAEGDMTLSDALWRMACDEGAILGCRMLNDFPGLVAAQGAVCEAGDLTVCDALGATLTGGILVPQDLPRAIAVLKRACDGGEATSCGRLAALYGSGTHLEPAPATALTFARRACDLEARRCASLAKLYADGTVVAQDPDRAEALYAQACAGGLHNPTLCRAHVTPLDPKSLAVEPLLPDALRAAAWNWRNHCVAGSAAACTRFARVLSRQSDARLSQAAQSLFSEACALGDPDACVAEAAYFDAEAALAAYRAACAAGSGWGCAEAALRDGGAPPADRLADLERACSAGLARACTQLGEVLNDHSSWIAKGFGLHAPAFDVPRAFALFQEACEAGDGRGCYFAGMGADPEVSVPDYADLPKSAERARGLYERACAAGAPEGCVARASLDLFGEAADKDRDRAFHFAQQACLLGGDCSQMEWLALERDRAAVKARLGVLEAALSPRYADFHPFRQGPVRRVRAGCAAGDLADCVALGDYYAGHGSVTGLVHDLSDDDWTDALYLHACEGGLALGCARYASEFEVGFRNDPARALAYHRQACDMGIAASCERAGYILERGDAGSVDRDGAAIHYHAGCSMGDAFACQQLWNVDLRDAEAEADAELRACLGGYGLACYLLATYEYKWSGTLTQVLFRIGCEDGEDDACRALRRY